MTLSPTELDKLYKMYGFEVLPTGTPKMRAYGFQRGYFHNADIIPLTSDVDASVNAVKADLDRAGFSSRIRKFASLRAAEDALFEGFFATQASNNRLKREYEKFTSRLSFILGGDYQYIESRYTLEDQKNETEKGLVSQITELLGTSGARLILLEAAAGFGKTCTAYEVLAALLKNSSSNIPILTELSRNRQAKIFRYVLLDEIDRNFPGINYNLVTHYIREGRIPLIIDGFDELLQDSTSPHAASFEETEAMLDTIRGLIGGQAKILLTTRRTAILSGDDFHRWLETHNASFDIHHFRIDPPTPNDWLGAEKTRTAQEHRIPLKQLANPVLLTFLRNLETEKYNQYCQSSGQIVQRYFESLLEREKIRQDLHMDLSEQMEIFRHLAADMLSEDFTADTREYIHLRIQEKNANLLSSVRERYPPDAKPTSDELANKLVNHALFDRFGTGENLIGFINDFVLGSFVGDVIVASSKGDWLGTERLADLAATSYAARSDQERRLLWTALRAMFDFFEANISVSADLSLVGHVVHSHKAATLQGHVIEESIFPQDGILTDCVITNCRFIRSTINPNLLPGCTFINCSFFECDFIKLEHQPEEFEILFLASSGDHTFEAFIKSEEANEDNRLNGPINLEEPDPAERAVLERFWPPGRAHFLERKAIRTLYLGLSGSKAEQQAMRHAVKRLEAQNIISLVRDYAQLNAEKLNEIRRILGRS